MIDIKKTLEKLNISKENMGTSTGNNFFGSGPQIESYSLLMVSLLALSHQLLKMTMIRLF